jgi:hypothetical protein
MEKPLAGLFALALLGGCAEVPGQDQDRSFDPGEWHFVQGFVSWEILETDCPSWTGGSQGWGEWGEVTVEEGQAFVVFPSLPQLSGPVEGNRADVSGRMQFTDWMNDGALVDCNVSGHVVVTDAEATGETIEVLTSEGSGLDCTTRGRFTVEQSDEPPPWSVWSGSGD